MSASAPAQLVTLASNLAQVYGLDPALVCAVTEQESAWNTWAMRYEPAFFAKYVASLYTNNKVSATEAYARGISWGLMRMLVSLSAPDCHSEQKTGRFCQTEVEESLFKKRHHANLATPCDLRDCPSDRGNYLLRVAQRSPGPRPPSNRTGPSRTIPSASASQAERDRQLATTLSKLDDMKAAAKTQQQILAKLPQILSLPKPRQVLPCPADSKASAKSSAQSMLTIPDVPAPKAAAVIPSENLKPLLHFAVDCRACQARLAAATADLADEKTKTQPSAGNETPP